MSDFCVYLEMPDYLKQWFVHQHGGVEPVTLAKGSVESLLLQRSTSIRPADMLPQLNKKENEVAIELPSSKFHDPRTYNHLSNKAKSAFLDLVRKNFYISIWEFLHDFGQIGKQQKDLIYLFMEQNGIEDDEKNWDVIAKIYQRQRKSYLTSNGRKVKKKHTK